MLEAKTMKGKYDGKLAAESTPKIVTYCKQLETCAKSAGIVTKIVQFCYNYKGT